MDFTIYVFVFELQSCSIKSSFQKINLFFQSKLKPRLWTSKLNDGAAVKVINTKSIAKTLFSAEKLFTEVSKSL